MTKIGRVWSRKRNRYMGNLDRQSLAEPLLSCILLGEDGLLATDYYTAQDIEQIATRFSELGAQHQCLQERIVGHQFSTPKGDEFAKHGFLRRSSMLWRCIQKTFDVIPPDLEGRPRKEDTKDATIFLHCFMIHVFGACDDLAWILAHEKGITKSDGSPLPSMRVGLRKNNERIRSQLSERMIKILDNFEEWFLHVDDFRHSLAHRIPLYVPPCVVSQDREDDYRRLERKCWEAILRGDIDEHHRLKETQDNITFFRPWFTHSYTENAPTVVIHPQMLADFGAVLELGQATLQELDGRPQGVR